jgi:hypothetical protein
VKKVDDPLPGPPAPDPDPLGSDSAPLEPDADPPGGLPNPPGGLEQPVVLSPEGRPGPDEVPGGGWR